MNRLRPGSPTYSERPRGLEASLSDRAPSLLPRTPPAYAPGEVVFRVHPSAIRGEPDSASPRPEFDALPPDLRDLLADLRRERKLRNMEPFFQELPTRTRRRRGSRLNDDARAIFHSDDEEYE